MDQLSKWSGGVPVVSDLPLTIQRLIKILYQNNDRRTGKLKKKGLKLAHYTSAENTLKILSGRSLWLRNATVMNDHSEIEHGRGILDRLLQGTLGHRLCAALDGAHDGVSNTVRSRYYQESHFAREQTYMMSLCEHEPDDWLGRLSMWRAYGGSRASVALVFNPDAVLDPSVSLNLYASPVLYGDDYNVAGELSKVIAELEAASETIAAIDADVVADLA